MLAKTAEARGRKGSVEAMMKHVLRGREGGENGKERKKEILKMQSSAEKEGSIRCPFLLYSQRQWRRRICRDGRVEEDEEEEEEEEERSRERERERESARSLICRRSRGRKGREGKEGSYGENV
jgi:hypothetical protein